MLRILMLAASLVIHGAVAIALYDFEPEGAIDAGAGDDMIVVEKGIALEGFTKSGEAQETVEAIEATPQEASAAREQLEEVRAPEEPVEESKQEVAVQPPPEAKPIEPEEPLPPEMRMAELPEQTDIINSSRGPDAEALRMRVPEPLVEKKPELEPVKEPQPEQLAALEEPEIVAVEEQQATGEAQTGGSTTERSAYFGRISKHLEKRKINPRSRKTGTVMVRLKIAPSGRLLEREVVTSSGVKLLDEAAVASVDKSSPFPPFTKGMEPGPLVVSVPFKFLVR